MKQISVLIKEPGKKPRHESIPNTLEALQRVVGGVHRNRDTHF